MKLVFISDLHLKPSTGATNRLFYQLLASWCNNIDGLYILGDFFDYWLGDDDDNQFIRQMKIHLQQFTYYTPTYFLKGNHDFTLGKNFAAQTGIKLIKDMHVLSLGCHNILLSHGDAFCTLDLDYQKMKRVLQHPLLMFLLLKTPLSWRSKIKDKLEQQSRMQANQKPLHIYQVVDESVIKFALAAKADVVIHGHTHNPGCYTLNASGTTIKRFEIPDWQDHPPGGYIMLENDFFTIIPGPHNV